MKGLIAHNSFNSWVNLKDMERQSPHFHELYERSGSNVKVELDLPN